VSATSREWREQIDPRWSMAAGLMRSMERSGLSRSGVLATMLDAGIQVETAVRTVGRCVTRTAPESLPNAHVNGAGPAIVFVNGWSASGLVWPRTLVDDLSRDHTVVRVDNRGTGWSHRLANPFTIRDMADDVIRVLDHLGIDRAVVAGLSMGGMIGQELAMRHPDRVAHLVLMGTRPPNPAYVPPASDVTARMMSPPPPGQPLSDFMLDRWIGVTGPGFAHAHPEAIADMVSAIVERPSARTAVLHQARAIGAWHGAERLRHLDVPTTILHGEHDPLIPVVNAMRMAQLIPDTRYHELPRVGHLVPYEALDATITAVRAASVAGHGRRRPSSH
jgi:3-oxoadipate enol-lactonase